MMQIIHAQCMPVYVVPWVQIGLNPTIARSEPGMALHDVLSKILTLGLDFCNTFVFNNPCNGNLPLILFESSEMKITLFEPEKNLRGLCQMKAE